MYLLLYIAIAKQPSLYLAARFNKTNPAMVVICPTKVLEHDMVCTTLTYR